MRIREVRPNPASAVAPDDDRSTELPGHKLTMRLTPDDVDGVPVKDSKSTAAKQVDAVKVVKNLLDRYGEQLAEFVDAGTIKALTAFVNGESDDEETRQESVRIRNKFGFETTSLRRAPSSNTLATFAEQLR